ncbi:S-adenosyl-L-methionine-dependent methyltransferase [Gracilaria domingensis]|nr:S-adenosyl-L-methionine-dependent methyltransferase [Gracilaria domingensis]
MAGARGDSDDARLVGGLLEGGDARRGAAALAQKAGAGGGGGGVMSGRSASEAAALGVATRIVRVSCELGREARQRITARACAIIRDHRRRAGRSGSLAVGRNDDCVGPRPLSALRQVYCVVHGDVVQTGTRARPGKQPHLGRRHRHRRRANRQCKHHSCQEHHRSRRRLRPSLRQRLQTKHTAQLSSLVSVVQADIRHFEPPDQRLYTHIYFSGSFMIIPDQVNVLTKMIQLLVDRQDGRIFFTQTFELQKNTWLEWIKPKLMSITTIDFGHVTYQQDFEDALAAADLSVESDQLIEDGRARPNVRESRLVCARSKMYDKPQRETVA